MITQKDVGSTAVLRSGERLTINKVDDLTGKVYIDKYCVSLEGSFLPDRASQHDVIAVEPGIDWEKRLWELSCQICLSEYGTQLQPEEVIKMAQGFIEKYKKVVKK